MKKKGFGMTQRNGWRSGGWSALLTIAALFLAGQQVLSAQGGSWTQATGAAGWSGRGGLESSVFNGRIWVTGGIDYSYQEDVWSSPDGVSWTLETSAPGWTARYEHASAVFNGRLWVLGGFDGGALNDVWSSVDGSNWVLETTSAGWAARSYHSTAVHGGKLWVMGGIDGAGSVLNDVWSSVDGISWNQETAAAPWSARYGQAVTVFNNKLWLAGGDDLYTSQFNDVWSSPDGVNWTPETQAAPWSVRGFHTFVSFNSRLWIIAGGSGSVNNEVWSSADGVSWQQESQATPWVARSAHTSVVFADGIWVLGGFDTSSNFLSDVWAYKLPPLITSNPVLTAIVGVPYTYSITAQGVPAPAINVAGLPAWLSFGGTQLTGTPGVGDIGLTGVISVTASSATGTDDQMFQIDVRGVAPVITSIPITTAQVGVAYSYTLSCTGTPDPLLFAGTLPGWLQFNSSTGELHGTPSSADAGLSNTINLAAINGWNPYALQAFQIDVLPASGGGTTTPDNNEDDSGCSSGHGRSLQLVLALVALAATAAYRFMSSRRC